MLGDPRNIGEGVRLIGGAISSGAQYIYGRYVKFTSWFNEYKEQHPIFKRIWGVATHPITLSLIGLAGSLALAPFIGGMTLPFAIGMGASVALTVSSPVIQAFNKYRLQKAIRRNQLLQIMAAKHGVEVIPEQKPLSWKGRIKSFFTSLPWDSIAIYTAATLGVFVGFGLPSAIAIACSMGGKVVSAGMEGKFRLAPNNMRQEILAQNRQLEEALKAKGIDISQNSLESAASEVSQKASKETTADAGVKTANKQSVPELMPVSFLKCLANEFNPFAENYDKELNYDPKKFAEGIPAPKLSKVEQKHPAHKSDEPRYETIEGSHQSLHPDSKVGLPGLSKGKPVAKQTASQRGG